MSARTAVTRRAAATAVTALAALVTSCSVAEDAPRDPADADAGASGRGPMELLGGSDGAGGWHAGGAAARTGGAASSAKLTGGTASAGGATSDAAASGLSLKVPACDGSAGPSPGDDGSAPPDPREAGADPFEGDAPPVGCVPPCLWERARRCRLTGACVTSEVTNGAHADRVSCATDGSWIAHSTDGAWSYYDVFVHGTQCFALETWPEWPHKAPAGAAVSWADPVTGEPIATLYSASSITCRATDGSAEATYQLLPESECEPWTTLGIPGLFLAGSASLTCSPGCCPSVPEPTLTAHGGRIPPSTP